MILASPTDVLNRLGMATSEDRLDSIKSALQGVTFKIESDLRTSLQQQARVDYFSVPVYRAHPRQIQLNLTQGFVDSTVPMVITVSSSGYVEDSTDTTILADDEYEIDFNNGKVTMHQYIYSGTETISVAYTAGYAVSSLDKIVGAPTWLGEAAKAATVLMLNAENFSRQKTKAFKADNNMANRIYTSIVNTHVRPRSSGISPWRGTEV